MAISLISPFPAEHIHLLWGWMCEDRLASFDDSGPRSLDEFRHHMACRVNDGQEIWEVLKDDVPVGAIGYAETAKGIGMFKGICFTKSVHGTGVAREAVSRVLEKAFSEGVGIVYARYFASNTKIARFLARFAAERLMRSNSNVLQGGKIVTWELVSITADAFRKVQGQGADQEIADRTETIRCA
jgi:RimJ/RimL family protein N-acetyltransferase